MGIEHDHLAQATRHIARAEEMISEQRDLHGLGGEQVSDVTAELLDVAAVVRPQHAAAFGTAQRQRFVENITVSHGVALQLLRRATNPSSARRCSCRPETGWA